MTRTLITSVVILMSMLSFAYETWTDPATGIKWTYTVSGSEASVGYSDNVTAVPKDTTGAIAIPSSLGGYTVTSIRYYAFSGCSGLTSVTIPSSVTSIGSSAFSGCSGLTSVTIPSSVTSIGQWAFYGCSGLTSVAIPCSVTSIGSYAFNGCNNILSIEVDENNQNYCSVNGLLLTKDGKTLVSGVNGIVTIPNSVTSIGYQAFYERGGLTSVTIPSSVTSIGDNAFYGCSGLTSVTIPSSVTSIGYSVFSGCQAVRSMTIPSTFSLQSLWGYGDDGNQDSGYKNLTNVVFASGCKAITQNVFGGCTNIQSVTIPSSVRRISGDSFQDLTELKSVTFLGDAPDVEVGAFYGTPRELKITVPDGSKGWSGGVSTEIPKTWADRAIVTASGQTATSSGSSSGFSGTIVVTNVVIHYIVNSVQSQMAVPMTTDTKFVNVMTEIKGGNVSIPETWASNYPTFEAEFGNDFSTALTKTTGKKDAAGNPMYVWQDYVAGTDPTDETSVFMASVTMVDGKPVVSYTPELTAEEKAKRKYTTWGKVKLQDENWVEVPSGSEDDYNFFKVTVEMK